jgi:hypothetical protein
MEEIEKKCVEMFLDKYSPDTKGQEIPARLDHLSIRLASLFVYAEQITAVYEKHFKGRTIAWDWRFIDEEYENSELDEDFNSID